MLVGGVLAMTVTYRAQTMRVLEGELDSTLVTLTRGIELLPDGRVVDIPEKLPSDPRYGVPLSGRYWAMIAVEAGDVLGNDIRPDSLFDAPVPIPEGMAQEALDRPGTTLYGNAIGPADEPVRTAVRSVTIPNREHPILMVASADRTQTDEGADQLRFILLIAMTTLAAGTLIAMWVGLRVVLRPFDRIQADIAEVREGRRAKLPEDYPSEVRPLSEELNKLLDHNKQVVERARTHVGNLAHALKTPIAVLRNEATGDTPLDDVVRRQSEAMRTNVEHYLKRAQAAARAQSLGARTAVGPLVDGIARLLNRLFDAQGIDVSHTIGEDVFVRCETQDMEEMLGNLMENACKWADMRVEVSAEQVENGLMMIHVDDDGGGLSPDDREAALQRGVRLDETAPGTGLGLSIVKELAELNGGGLELSQAPLGGLRATVRLRRA